MHFQMHAERHLGDSRGRPAIFGEERWRQFVIDADNRTLTVEDTPGGGLTMVIALPLADATRETP